MSFKPYTEKIMKKKIGICLILGRIRIRIQNRTQIHHPGSGSVDPDPHQNDTDPKNCFLVSFYPKVHLFENTILKIKTQL